MDVFTFPVVPICEAQRRDVRPEDLIDDGVYRRCRTYRAGGGYDRFPEICRRVVGDVANVDEQFVVQLRGCPLDCAYCYVTRVGVHGDPVRRTPEQIVAAFAASGCGVLHLMGGAPALYLERWADVVRIMPPGTVFHSDLLMIERRYDLDTLRDLRKRGRVLLAVSIKGTSADEFRVNTGRALDLGLFECNLATLVKSRVPFYVTFTGVDEHRAAAFAQRYLDADVPWFVIPVIRYRALDD